MICIVKNNFRKFIHKDTGIHLNPEKTKYIHEIIDKLIDTNLFLKNLIIYYIRYRMLEDEQKELKQKNPRYVNSDRIVNLRFIQLDISIFYKYMVFIQ